MIIVHLHCLQQLQQCSAVTLVCWPGLSQCWPLQCVAWCCRTGTGWLQAAVSAGENENDIMITITYLALLNQAGVSLARNILAPPLHYLHWGDYLVMETHVVTQGGGGWEKTSLIHVFTFLHNTILLVTRWVEFCYNWPSIVFMTACHEFLHCYGNFRKLSLVLSSVVFGFINFIFM